jgi:hypothetical protein
MPKLLALGGPRDGRLVYIADDAREVTFELAAPFPADPPQRVSYRRATTGDGTEVLVHESVPADADLEGLYRTSSAAHRESGQWDGD